MLVEHINTYLRELSQALMLVDRQAVWAVVEELMRAWREHRQVLLFGNGGSAALAGHWANDLNKIVVPGRHRMRALALSDNISLLTALANDLAYDQVFAEQLYNFCQPGDVVIAISCSGNSPNVLEGVRVAREIGASIIGVTGDEGGQLKEMVNLCVRAPAAAIQQQEDIHQALEHMIAGALRNWISTRKGATSMPKALILAAGEGTRLHPLTLDRPKPMVPIVDRPLLEHTIDWLRSYGITDIAINLHHRPQVIRDHFGDGSDRGVRITYVYENPVLGTAGAIRNLGEFLDDSPLLVVYGDVLTDLDLSAFLAFHEQRMQEDPATGITMSLYRVPNPTEVGLVDLAADARITRFVEKPEPEAVFTDLASAGILVLEPGAVSHIPPGQFYDLGRHLFPRLLAEGVPMYGWPIPPETYLLDIGTPEKYVQAQQEWPCRRQV